MGSRKNRKQRPRPTASDGFRNQDSGDIGELEFELIAQHAGFVAQKPEKDRHGWDRLLERQLIDATSKPADVQPGVFRAYFQVKTTAAAEKPRVALSVAAQAAKDPAPWFFVHILLGKGDQVERFCVLHLDDVVMADILRAQRKGGASTKKVNLPWHLAKAFRKDEAQAFGKWLMNLVGDPPIYSARKVERLNSIGYDEAPGRVSFQLGGNQVEHLADAFVGLRDNVVVTAVRIGVVRFGIYAEDIALPSAQLRFNVKETEARLIVTQSEGPGRIDLPVRLKTTPSGFPPRVLIRNEFMSLEFTRQIDWSFQLPSERNVSLQPACDTWRLIELLNKGEPIDLHLAPVDQPEPKRFATLKGELSVDEGLSTVLQGARVVERLLSALGHRVAGVNARPTELRSIAAHTVYATLADAAERSDPMPDCSCRAVSIDGKPECEPNGIFLMNAMLPLATQVFVMALATEGPVNLEEVDDGWALTVNGSMRLHRTKMFVRKANSPPIIKAWLSEVGGQLRRAHQDLTVVEAWTGLGE